MARKKIKKNKVQKVMKEFARGDLKSSSGQKVTNPKQALAIGYSEQKEMKNKDNGSKTKRSTKKSSKKTDPKRAKSKKKVTVAKGVKVMRGQEEKMRSKMGSSNAGKYKNVSPKKFAGAAGGASKYSYPINTKSRAKAALAYARNAPNPKGIREAVYKRYPELKPKKKSAFKRKKKK